MSSPSIPGHPCVPAHVYVRRHLAGDDEWFVLHDQRSGRTLRLSPVQWRVLAAADGTRDLAGLVYAAERDGVEISRDGLVEFITYLFEHEMLVDGPGSAPHLVPAPAATSDRLLDVLPHYRFRCTGSGDCCVSFSSVLFTEREAERARVVLDEDIVFLPSGGSVATPIVAITMTDGGCDVFAEGRCRLHERGGPDAKPAACREFPVELVDDGERVRVSIAVECACVLESLDDAGGEPLAPDGAVRVSDLDVATSIRAVPSEIAVGGGHVASRDELRAWLARFAAKTPPRDVAAASWNLATALESSGLVAAALDSFDDAALEGDELRPWLDALHERARAWGKTHAAFRSERDLTRRAMGWIAEAAGRLVERCASGPFAVPVLDARAERFYVRTDIHGVRHVDAVLPMSAALRVRAIRLLLARVLPEIDGTPKHPLPMVEAAFRSHGLDAFCHSLVG